MSEQVGGRVVKFTKERGFGFVQPDDGGQDVFIHIAELTVPGDARKLRVGQVVTFRREEGDRGPKAMEVVIGRPARAGTPDDGMSDLLTAAEFRDEIDGLLDMAFRKAKLEVREELAGICRGHGWVD